MGESRSYRRRRRFLRSIGPELVAGASDNDPTNVGTAVTVGARTGYQLAWVAVLVAPLLAVVQVIAAKVGTSARADLQSLTLKRYGRGVATILLISVIVVNIVTIAADLQAGAAGIGLLTRIEAAWIVIPFGLALVAFLLFGKYEGIVSVLRYAMSGFLAFGIAAWLARPDWLQVARYSLFPSFAINREMVAGGLALLGTTLTSYVYVWETVSRGVERCASPQRSDGAAARARTGAILSAAFTALVLWFMIIASAAALGGRPHGAISAQGAAQALHSVAGARASDVFAIGLIVSALVALPVLMSTTAYVAGAHFDWRRGLSERLTDARAFYCLIAASLGLAFLVSLLKISVVGMLFVASIVGGLGTPIGLILLVLLGRDHSVMGAQTISTRLALAGWATAIIVGLFGLLFLCGSLAGAF
jgi:Mn2+/Fe2+ NRAMP family transporter